MAFDVRFGAGLPVAPPRLLHGDFVEPGVIVRKVFAILIQITIYSTVFSPLVLALPLLLLPASLVAATLEVSATVMWIEVGFSVFLGSLPLVHHVLASPGARLVDDFGLRGDFRAFTFGVFGAGLGVAVYLLLLLASSVVAIPESEVGSAIKASMVDTLRSSPVLLIVLPVVAAFSEEIVFRGFMQPRLGLAATSVIFGVAHMGWLDPFHLAFATAAGFGLGYLYLRSRTLWAPIAAHLAYDGIIMLMIWRGVLV